MKTIKILSIVLLVAAFSSTSYSKTTRKATPTSKVKLEKFKVWGTCESCQARIEKAAKIDGVDIAHWNKKTKKFIVAFDPVKTSDEAIQKSIAAVGHDTEKFKANDKVYDKLPGCCKYERKQ